MTEALSDEVWTTLRIQIPPELSGYGPELRRFFDAMIYKLRRNAHKGKWEDTPLRSAFNLLEHEVEELHTVVGVGSTCEILMEAADVANMGLIVANIAMEARDEQSRTSFHRWHATKRPDGWVVGRLVPASDGGRPLFEFVYRPGAHNEPQYFATEGVARARADALNTDKEKMVG